MKKEEYSFVTMVERSCAIMDELYNSHTAIGITEISKKLKLPKATTYRIIITLIKSGFIEKDIKTDKYMLGKIFVKYGDKVKSELNIHNMCEPFMEELALEVGETINLSISHENAVLYLKRVEGEATALVSKLISISPYYCSSTGKILLAYKTDKEVRKYFKETKIIRRTINTIKTPEEFYKERAQILKDGYAFDNEEYDYGLYCVGTPIFNTKGDVIAAISFSGPKSRINYKGEQKMIEKLIIYTSKINNRIKEIGI